MTRGELYVVATGSGYGSKPRPAVIVQSDLFEMTDSVTVCLMTTREIEAAYIRVAVVPSLSNGLDEPSWIMMDKILAIHRRKVGQRIGRLEEPDVRELNQALVLFLGLVERSSG